MRLNIYDKTAVREHRLLQDTITRLGMEIKDKEQKIEKMEK